MKKRLPFLIIGIVIIAGITIWFQVLKGKKNTGEVRISGNIEVIDAQLGFKIAGRLEKRFVDEGDKIVKGTLIARLENFDQKISVALASQILSGPNPFFQNLKPAVVPRKYKLPMPGFSRPGRWFLN